MAFAINKGYRKNNTLDKEGWDLVINRLGDENEINVDFAILKNHYDKGRKLWQGWNELRGYTGLGWNELTNTFICPPHVWLNFIKRHKDCKRLKNWGYDVEAEANLYAVYSNNHASGRWKDSGVFDTIPYIDNASVPYSDPNVAPHSPPTSTPTTTPTVNTQSQPDAESSEWPAGTPWAYDSYNRAVNDLIAEDLGVDNQAHEGVGNSTTLPCMGRTNQPQAHGSTTQATGASPSQPTPPPSRRVQRNRTPATRQRSTKRKQSEVEVSSGLQVLFEAMKDRNEIVRGNREEEIDDYDKCIDLLEKLPGYNDDDELYSGAPSFFLDKNFRRLFLAMGRDPVRAEKWLRVHYRDHRPKH